jgi:hypothetical protein
VKVKIERVYVAERGDYARLQESEERRLPACKLPATLPATSLRMQFRGDAAFPAVGKRRRIQAGSLCSQGYHDAQAMK